MNRVIVTINGSDYPMVSEKSEAYMIKVAKYVDEEMSNLSQKNTRLSLSNVAVLTALNIADGFFEVGYENEELLKKKKTLKKEIEN